MEAVSHALILVTCPHMDEARTIARRLVDDRRAAGVQIIPIDSIYRWDDKVVEDTEVLLIIKTRADLFPAIRATVEELHSYEVPPVVMLPIAAANEPYLGWIDQVTGP